MAVIRPVSVIWRGILPGRKHNGSYVFPKLFLTSSFQKKKFCLQDIFLVVLPCAEETLGTDTLISEKEDSDNDAACNKKDEYDQCC